MQPQDLDDENEEEKKQKEAKKAKELIGADESLLCGMCHVKELGDEPVIALACRHVFHYNCIVKRLYMKWTPNKRVTFNFLDCPVCKNEISLTKY